MSLGELLTRWTIRLALLLYLAVIAGHLWWGPLRALPSKYRWWEVSRGLWTLGCVVLLLHMAAAFHYYHHWSHADAAAETLRQTRVVVGLSFAGGIYFNYALALLWVGDCLWWWWDPMGYPRRPRWITIGLHVYLLFIVVNGAVVFEAGPTRWVGLVASAGLLGLAARRWWNQRNARELV